jgi:hypothetical protein
MDAREIGEALREPFPLSSLGWKPQSVKGNRALAVAYIDARDVMQRLDDVVGVENWQDDYTVLGDGQVMCKLSVRINGQWVAKCDVGGESEQPDKGDREKDAFSDALKRAAVKFGIGRYLYAMPSQWCDYDPAKKQFTQTPAVAPQFLPQRKAAPPKQSEPPKSSPEDAARAMFRAAKTFDELAAAWKALPKAVQVKVEADKDRRKAELAAADADLPDYSERGDAQPAGSAAK